MLTAIKALCVVVLIELAIGLALLITAGATQAYFIAAMMGLV